MTRINMTRINLFRNTPTRIAPSALDTIAWGKMNLATTASPLVFAAILIVCSLAVGCSSQKPKTESSTSPSPNSTAQVPVTTPVSAPMPSTTQPPATPVGKKVVHKAPVTALYADKTLGISFRYPRRYVLKTGDAADELVSSDALPMNFSQTGGVPLAAVAVPESVYPKSDLASALFNVSVNKALTAEQCGQFSEPKPAAPSDNAASPAATSPAALRPSKLMIGDLELQSAETLASQGILEEVSKYYHIFENGTCYEFALKVATTTVENEGAKHVDRDEVFKRLGKILATVKIIPVQEATASAPASATPVAVSETPSETPAQ